MLIEGSISVKAAILNHKRVVHKVYIDVAKKTKDFNFIRKITKENNIELEELDKEALANLAEGKSFGGVLALVENRINDNIGGGDIFYFEGIEDPFNLGYMMRNLYAFGIKNIILPKRDYTNMEAQLLKSSAGAYDMLNVCVVEEPLKTIQELKKNGYKVYALVRSNNSKDIFDTKFVDKSLFMIGGEKRGITSSLLNEADENLYISYGSDFRNSLNACNALAVVSTLLYSQRRK